MVYTPVMVEAQQAEIAVYDSFDQLEERILSEQAPIVVVNFWATWCKPCVEELPYFEKLQRKYKTRRVKVLLVSLDFKSQLDKRLKPFVEEKDFVCEVVLLADQDADAWIPRINPDWDGAIPVTAVYNKRKNKKGFHNAQFEDYCELECFVRKFL